MRRTCSGRRREYQAASDLCGGEGAFAARRVRKRPGLARVVPLVSLGVASLAIAVLAGSRSACAAEEERYVDRAFGFSFARPHFTPSDQKGATTVVVTLAGAQVGPFAPNVNVVVQNLETTLDAYEQLQRKEMQAIGWELLEHSRTEVGGRPALRTHARGPLHGLQLESLAITLIRDEKSTVVMTCMATIAEFGLYRAEFDRALGSFVLEP